ncbi:hypothetical protein FOL46_009949 [Perkinsus olseni]|uniref:Transmembrane protein n=1 Tax=Perkinsus olseni TaxID=32597 RepID=A0A7J6MJC7_PEROL|nr:hypothetical protein FOL46_009949 [Perkinsus olseni]
MRLSARVHHVFYSRVFRNMRVVFVSDPPLAAALSGSSDFLSIMTSPTADISPKGPAGVPIDHRVSLSESNSTRAAAAAAPNHMSWVNQHHHHRANKSSAVSAPLYESKAAAFTSHVVPEGSGDHRRRSSHLGEPSAVATYKDYTYWIKIVFSLGVAQLFLEAGMRAAFMVEVSVYGNMAYLAHFIIFAVEVPISLLMAPMIYRWFELHTQAKFLSSLGALSTVLYVYQLAYAVNYPENTVDNSPMYVAAAVFLGMLYPLVEITNYAIIGRSGYFKCRDPTRPTNPLDITRQPEDGHYHNHPNNNRHHGLLGETLGLVEGTPPPVISAFSSVAFVVKHKTFLIIMPLIVVGGMVDAYFYGEYTLFVATPYLGQRAIPFLIGCLFFTQGLASWAYGMLVYKGHLRRRMTILIGAAALSSFFVFRILLFYSNRGIIENFRQDPSSPDKWRKNQDPTPWEFTMVFALTILLAMGRAAYDSQIPAVLYHHYQLTEFHVIAVGNYKAYRSMGSLFINALDLWALDKVKGIYSDERTFPTTSVVLLEPFIMSLAVLVVLFVHIRYYMTDSYGPPAWGSGALDGQSIMGAMTRFYGIYIGSYAGAGVLLIILGLLLLQLPKQLDLGEYKGLAFWSLGMLSLVGTFLYLGIPPCPRSDVIPGSPVPCVSPWRTFIFPIAHRRFRVYALLLVVCGMVEAYGYVDFVMYISTPRIGPRASSLVTGFALFIDGLVAFMYGWLVYRGFCTLRTVVLLGAIALVLAMAYCAALSAAVMVSSGVGEGGGKNSSSILGLNYTRVSDGPEKWIEIDDVEVYDYFVVASCIILIALGLLPYKAHLSSVTQQIYQPTPYHLQVSAHLKGLRSLGFMVQMGFDNLISSYYGISQTSNLIAALVLLVIIIVTIHLAAAKNHLIQVYSRPFCYMDDLARSATTAHLRNNHQEYDGDEEKHNFSASGDDPEDIIPQLLPQGVNSRRATVSGAVPSVLRGGREYHTQASGPRLARSVSINDPLDHHHHHGGGGGGVSRTHTSSSVSLYQSRRRSSQGIFNTNNPTDRQWRFTSSSSVLTIESKSRAISSVSTTQATVSTYKDSSYWFKTVFALAVAKAFVEAGLRSAYVNEVSAFGGSAFFRGFLMLIIEVLVCWMCPMVHRWFELHTAVKYLLFIGGIGAAVHVYYLVLGTALSSFSKVGYISACVIAALLYPLDSVASYVIIGRSAYFRCRDPTRTGASEETLARSNFREMLSKNLSWFYGIYFSSYFGAGIINMFLGSLYSAIRSEDESLSYLMLAFWLSGMLSLTGAFLYLAIPPCPRTDAIPGTPAPQTSPIQTAVFPVRAKQYMLFAPLLLACGMVEGFLYGDFIVYLVQPMLGSRVGNFITGMLQIFTGFSAIAFALVLYKITCCRKRLVIFLGTFLLVTGLVTFSIYVISLDNNAPAGSIIKPNYQSRPSSPEKWDKIGDPTVLDYALVLTLLGVIAAGVSAYQSQIPAIVNTMYQETEYHLMANANFKGLRSAGYALQLALSFWVYPSVETERQQLSSTTRLISPVVIIGSILLAYWPLCASCIWSALPMARDPGNSDVVRDS